MPACFSVPCQLPTMSIAQINYPATTIVVADSKNSDNNTSVFWNGDIQAQSHGGRNNYLFDDGHVKTMLPSATVTPLNMWNVQNTGLYYDTTPGPATDPFLTYTVGQDAAIK